MELRPDKFAPTPELLFPGTASVPVPGLNRNELNRRAGSGTYSVGARKLGQGRGLVRAFGGARGEWER
jgi:hypothetical protein